MVHSLQGKARHFEMTTEHRPERGLRRNCWGKVTKGACLCLADSLQLSGFLPGFTEGVLETDPHTAEHAPCVLKGDGCMSRNQSTRTETKDRDNGEPPNAAPPPPPITL